MYSCKKEKTNLEQAIEVCEKTQAIKDTILKFKESYNTDLVVCYYDEYPKTHVSLSFMNPSQPYKLDSQFYDYKQIEGVDVIFKTHLGWEKLAETERRKISLKLMNNEPVGKNLFKIQKFLDEGKVVFTGLATNNDPTIDFVYCKNDVNNIICYDYIMLREMRKKYREKGLKPPFPEEVFYPKCN